MSHSSGLADCPPIDPKSFQVFNKSVIRSNLVRRLLTGSPPGLLPRVGSGRAQEATMLQFKVGNKVVYPAQGVAEVIGIETKEIGGRLTSFYLLRIMNSDMRILVPQDKAHQVGLREVASPNDVEEVL